MDSLRRYVCVLTMEGSKHMEKITSAQRFDELLKESSLAIVKLETTWCPDCRRVEKGYAEYAETNKQRATFAELDADQVREVAERFDVRGIPTFLVFRDGELVDRLYSRDAKTVQQVVNFADKALQEYAGHANPA